MKGKVVALFYLTRKHNGAKATQQVKGDTSVKKL
jgi:hypothetical protein